MAEINLTDQNFESEVLESDLPVLVDFYADWCAPCQMAAPIIEELAQEYKGKIKIGKLNVEQGSQTSQKYGVMSIPTVIIFKNGKEVKKLIGFPGKEGYKKLLKEVLV